MKKRKELFRVTNNVIVDVYSKGTSTETYHNIAEAGGRQKGGNRMIMFGIMNLIDAQKEKRKAELKEKAQDDIRALRERSYRLRKENAKPGEPVPKTFEEYLALSEKEFVEAAGKSYNTEGKETL